MKISFLMNRSLSTLLLFFLVVRANAMEVKNDVALSFNLDSSETYLNEPVTGILNIKNNSQERIEIDLGIHQEQNLELVIKTPAGTKVIAKAPERWGISKIGRIELAADQAYDQKLILNNWYSFEESGHYQIQLQIRSKIKDATGNFWALQPVASVSLNVNLGNPVQLEIRAQELLNKILTADNLDSSAQYAAELSSINDPVVVEYLQPLLAKHPILRGYAIEGLVQVGNVNAVEALMGARSQHGEESDSLITTALHRISVQSEDSRARAFAQALLAERKR